MFVILAAKSGVELKEIMLNSGVQSLDFCQTMHMCVYGAKYVYYLQDLTALKINICHTGAYCVNFYK